MASRYEININANVKGGSKYGRSGAQAAQVESAAQQRRTEQRKSDPNKRGSEGAQAAESARSMRALSQAIPKLTQAISRLEHKIAQGGLMGGRPGFGTPGYPGAGGRSGGTTEGVGRGVGGIGRAVPFIGAAVAAMGWIISRVMNVGKAYMQFASQQTGTSGAGGFYTSGGQGTLTAAQMGQYSQARALAGGRAIRPWDDKRYGKGWFSRHEDISSRAMQMFGIAPAQYGRMVGLSDIFTGGRGRQSINQIVKGYGGRNGGINPEMQFMFTTLTSALEDAVSEGVNNSDLAKDMAKEMAGLAAYSPNKQMRSALNITRNLMGVQKQLGRGQGFDSIQGFEMYQAGRQVLRQRLMGTDEAGKKFTDQMVKEGVLTKEQVANFRKTGQMGVYTEQYLTQRLLQRQPGDVRNRMLSNITSPLMRGPGERSERMGRAVAILQSMGIQLSAAEFGMIFNRQKYGDKPGQTRLDDATMKKTLEANQSSARTVAGHAVRKEATLSRVGPEAMKTVIAFDNAMMNLAEKMAPTVNKMIPGLTGAIETLGKTAVGAIKAIEGVAKGFKKMIEFFQSSTSSRGGSALFDKFGRNTAAAREYLNNAPLFSSSEKKDMWQKYMLKVNK